jgi:curli biogenesis system outer membrane secretion channel CsgG
MIGINLSVILRSKLNITGGRNHVEKSPCSDHCLIMMIAILAGCSQAASQTTAAPTAAPAEQTRLLPHPAKQRRTVLLFLPNTQNNTSRVR